MILTGRCALQSLSWVLPRLQTRQQSLSVTFSIQTHNRCDVNEPNVDVALKIPMAMNQVRCRIEKQIQSDLTTHRARPTIQSGAHIAMKMDTDVAKLVCHA